MWQGAEIVAPLGAVGLLVLLGHVLEAPVDFLIAAYIGMFWPLVSVLRKRVERDVMTIYPDRIELYRNRFGVGYTKKFMREHVEGFGFVPGRAREGNVLGIRDRLHVLGVDMSRGIRSDEANEVLTKLESFGTWLTPMIRPVGTPLFFAEVTK